MRCFTFYLIKIYVKIKFAVSLVEFARLQMSKPDSRGQAFLCFVRYMEGIVFQIWILPIYDYLQWCYECIQIPVLYEIARSRLYFPNRLQ